MIVRRANRLTLLAIALLAVCRSALAATNPTPILYQPLVPAATVPGGAGFTLTVNGTGFVQGAVVNWNGSPRQTTFVSSSQVAAAIAAADIATMGTATITVTNPGPGGGTSNPEYFQVTYPNSTLAFQDATIPASPSTSRTIVGDFSGDGKPDVVTLNIVPSADGKTSNYVIQLFLGNGDGTFQAPLILDQVPAGIYISDLAAADLNGDGKLDLVGSYHNFNNGGGETFALLGNGDGTFQPPLTSGNFPAGIVTETVIADVNGDGIPDLVRVCGGICVELGNGDGTFRLVFSYVAPNPSGGSIPAQSVVVGDFHKNGKLDIIAGFNFFQTPSSAFFLVMLPGNGDGTFGTTSVIYEGQTQTSPDNSSGGLESLVAADFYNDGNLDLAFYYTMPNPPQPSAQPLGAVTSLRGNGDGTFQGPITVDGFPTTSERSPLVVGDFNGDGFIDLAVKNTILLLAPGRHSLVPLQSSSLANAAADFNGDGRLDLVGFVIDNANGNELDVLTQTSVPDFMGQIQDPPYQNVRPGRTGTYRIVVDSINGFAGTIEFSTSTLPPGVTATLSPSSLTGSGTVTVTLHTSRHTPLGSYLILVTGTSVGISHSGGIRLNVEFGEERFEDFSGTVTPTFQTIVPGSSTKFQIAIIPRNGFDDEVRLHVSGLPPGATATFKPREIHGGSGSSVLTISTVDPTPTATYHLTITAAGGRHKHTNSANLNVGPAGTDFTDYTGSITPESQTVKQGGRTSFTITIQPQNGTGCVSLQVFGLPAFTNGSFDRTTPICGNAASTVFTITTSPQTPLGTYTITFQGNTTGGFTHSGSVQLTVVTP